MMRKQRQGDGAAGRHGDADGNYATFEVVTAPGRLDSGGKPGAYFQLSCCRSLSHFAPSPRRPVALSSDKAPESGFVLWEVLLAFGIFCLASVGFIAALDQTIFTVTLVRDESEIRHDFENFFAEARTEKLQAGTKTLNSSDDRIRYERQVEAIKAKNQQGAVVANLFQITLTARWTLQNQERTNEAKVIVYQP